MRNLLSSLFVCAAVTLSASLPAIAAEKSNGKPIPSADKKFIKDAGEAMVGVLHLTEIVRSETSPGGEELKSTAKPLGADLNTAWGELGTIAQGFSESGKQVEMPKTESSSGEKRQIDQMKKLTTDKFDKAFLKSLAKETKKLAKVTEDGVKQVQDPEVKAWAEKWAPGFKGHDEKVEAAEKAEAKKK